MRKAGMVGTNILVIEDERAINDLIAYNLRREGFYVEQVFDGLDAEQKLQQEEFNIVILDLMLPGIEGLEVCRILKNDARTSGIPIIILTAKGDEADIVTGLELGADDYVTKPFSPRVLLARIKAILRRGKDHDDTGFYSKHGISLNISTHEVLVDGNPADLTATEFNILLLLIKRPGWVFTRNQIINSVKGDDYPVTDRSIDVQIVGLRKKLGLSGKYVETVRGVGYRMKE